MPADLSSSSSSSSTEDFIPLEIRHYGQEAGEYILYDDDGESFDYEKGEYAERKFEITNKKGKLKGKAYASEGQWETRYGEVSWVFMSEGK